MPHSKLIAIITALVMMSGGSSGQAQDRYAKLLYLETLISRKDCGAMRGFIRENPDMTAGSDPLAVELRAYANRLDSGLIECISDSSSLAAREGELDRSITDVSNREIY